MAALLALPAGCGSSGRRTPQLSELPLADGAQVVARATRCDHGAGAFCGIELVVVDRRYRSSADLLKAQRHRLKAAGWAIVNGDIGDEQAAESPGRRLRATYATADGDLRGIDLGWIKRSRTVTLALSRSLFARAPALSMLLEEGPG